MLRWSSTVLWMWWSALSSNPNKLMVGWLSAIGDMTLFFLFLSQPPAKPIKASDNNENDSRFRRGRSVARMVLSPGVYQRRAHVGLRSHPLDFVRLTSHAEASTKPRRCP